MNGAIVSQSPVQPEWRDCALRSSSAAEGCQVARAPIVQAMTARDVAAAEQITEAQARSLMRRMARVVRVYSLPVAGARGLRIDPGDYLTWKAQLPPIDRTERTYSTEIDARCAERDNRLVALGIIRIGRVNAA